MTRPSRPTRPPRPTGPSRVAGRTRLVALDIDGTILDHDARMTARVRSAVARVDAVEHVVIATGRSLYATLPVLDRLGLDRGWAVCSNGSVILRLDPELPDRYEISDLVSFDPTPALELLREHLPTALYAVEEVGRGYRLTAPFPDGELDGEQILVPFAELLHVPATRVIVRAPDLESRDFLDLVAELGLHEVSYAVGWTAWLDLAPDGVSKASALETVRQRLGVAPDRTVAVGDGRNDLEMFGWAARAVAMGNADPEVLAAADEITGHVDDDGLVPVLDALLDDPIGRTA